MHLTKTTQSIQVLTSAATALHVHACWEDKDSTVATQTMPGSAVLSLSSASASAVVPAPANNNVRTLTHLTMKAPSAGAGVTATLQAVEGTTVIDIFSADLAPGDQVCYVPGQGFSLVLASGIPATEDQFADPS